MTLAACAAAAQNAPTVRAIFQCVEFRYTAFPRQLWERELVWMKNVGITGVAITVPRDWDANDQRPSRDLIALLRLMRKLELTAWIEPERETPELKAALEPYMQGHGGPIAWWGVNGAPLPVTRLSSLSAGSLNASRDALANGRGTLVWTDVEDTVSPTFHHGAISFSGEEAATLIGLRRDTLLVHYWAQALPALNVTRPLSPVTGKLPLTVTAKQLVAGDAGPSAISVVNKSRTASYTGQLRVYYPPAKRPIELEAVTVPPGDSLWLPVNVPLGGGVFCKNCDALGNGESIVYATAELTGVEYENGILAMEFSAPAAGHAVLHLAKEPSGPLVAGGKPTEFDWDKETGRVRLPIPAGTGAAHRVRIALALEPPDNSAFFGDAKVLIIGQENTIGTTYSSEDVAKRSRVRAPAGFKLTQEPKTPNEIDYKVTAPADALHGDHVELALEADGVQMGHARLQLLRPASLRIREAINRHFGSAADLPVAPPLVAVDQRAGRSISVTIRNNFPEIKNYVLELSGEGVEFIPARTEIAIAGASERDVSVRVFADKAPPGPHEAKLRLNGAAVVETDAKFVVVPRGTAVAYTADLDGDGNPEYVLETQRARAVFTSEAAERWLEFVWKDSERNVLPEAGVALGLGTRKLTLQEATLTIEQDAPIADLPKPGKRGDVQVEIEKSAPSRAIVKLSR